MKDNTICFKYNQYSVPTRTCMTCKSMKIQVLKQGLTIINKTTSEVLAKHTIILEKGKLIKNKNHSRDRSKTIN